METSNQSGLARVVRRVGRWIRNYFVFVGIMTTLLLFLVARGIQQYTAPTVDPLLASGQDVALHYKLRGQIVETSPERGLSERVITQLLGKPQGPYILEVKGELERAAKDPHVKGLFLEIGELSGSLVAFTELRQVFQDFKQAGKPIYSWLASGDNKSYYLASVATELYLAPVGELTIPGPAFEMVYFGEALRKLGVEIEALRVGRFKSAVDPFVLNTPSDDSLLMYESLEKSLRGHMAEQIKDGRRLADKNIVDQWFYRTLYTAQAAKEQGLVDAVIYPQEAKDKVSELLHSQLLDAEKYKEEPQSLLGFSGVSGQGDGIALIEAAGEIHMHARGDEEAIVPERIIEQLIWAGDEDHVKAVTLRISSPGGGPNAADLIWDEVRKLAAKKPVVVSMGTYAASGGYYIAAPATKIYALPTTLTGSIGVFGVLPNFRAFDEKYGVSFHIVTHSARRGMLNPGSRPSAEDKQILTASIEGIYSTFLNRVASGRSLSVERVDEIAQGRVWTGAQAKDIGLVDELGGLYEAMQEAKRLAKFDPSIKVPVLRWQPPIRNFSDCLRNMSDCFPASGASLLARKLLQGAAVPSGLSGLKAVERLERWATHLQSEPVQAIWPGYFGDTLAQ